MAIIRKIDHVILERDSKHTEVDATYSIIQNNDGVYLQIDTYGSSKRMIKGKKSQSIRFSPEAMEQLCEILDKIGYCPKS